MVPILLLQMHMIIIGDPNRATADMLVRRLRQEGLTSETVADGPAMIVRIQAGGVRAVILDPAIAGNEGHAVLRRLRADPVTARLPVLVLSASDRPEALGAAARAGASDYLVKGRVSPNQLVARLTAQLAIAEEGEGPHAASQPLRYMLRLLPDVEDAPRLGKDLRAGPRLTCSVCGTGLTLVLTADLQRGPAALYGGLGCRPCHARATAAPVAVPAAAH